MESYELPHEKHGREVDIKSHFEDIAGEYYRIVDRLWSSLGYFHMRELEYVDQHTNTGIRALDAGCGPGRHSETLSNKGNEVVSLDISRRMLMRTKERCAKNPVHLVQGSVKALPFKDGVFDVSILMEVIEHLPKYYEDADRAIAEIIRVLKEDAKAIVETPLASHSGIHKLLAKIGIDLRVDQELTDRVKRIHENAPLFYYRPNLWGIERILRKHSSVVNRCFIGVIPTMFIKLSDNYEKSRKLDRMLGSIPIVREFFSREVIWTVCPRTNRTKTPSDPF